MIHRGSQAATIAPLDATTIYRALVLLTFGRLTDDASRAPAWRRPSIMSGVPVREWHVVLVTGPLSRFGPTDSRASHSRAFLASSWIPVSPAVHTPPQGRKYSVPGVRWSTPS